MAVAQLQPQEKPTSEHEFAVVPASFFCQCRGCGEYHLTPEAAKGCFYRHVDKHKIQMPPIRVFVASAAGQPMVLTRIHRPNRRANPVYTVLTLSDTGTHFTSQKLASSHIEGWTELSPLVQFGKWRPRGSMNLPEEVIFDQLSHAVSLKDEAFTWGERNFRKIGLSRPMMVTEAIVWVDPDAFKGSLPGHKYSVDYEFTVPHEEDGEGFSVVVKELVKLPSVLHGVGIPYYQVTVRRGDRRSFFVVPETFIDNGSPL